jgi:S1-C subfamily serine protease
MNWIDLIIVGAALVYAVGGYRNGAVVGVFSLAGFFGGAVLGAQLARPLGSRLAGGQAQVPIAIGCVLIVSLVCQLIAVWVAGYVRRRITWQSARALDSGIGAVLGIVSVLVVSWMVAISVAYSPYQSLDSAVKGSRVVRGVDSVMPKGVQNLYSGLQDFIDRSGFPHVFGALQELHSTTVSAPDPALLASAGVAAAKPSVLKIHGTAPSCDRAIEGSGFVYAPHRMLTNAHVVAGTDVVDVEVSPTESLAAKVVLYDPERDVAVLDVAGLTAQPIPFAAKAAVSGDDAIVLGYPEDGGFDVRPARVRDLGNISGHDIYGSGSITRQIYSVRSTIRSGNSGGPLITPGGSVLGIVFATATDSNDTGFVLSNQEVSPDADAGRAATAAVGTGGCD